MTWTLDIVRRIAREEGLRFRLAVISADVPKPVLLDAVAAGDLRPLPPGPEAVVEDVVESSHAVAQMGVEPLVRALDLGADVVFAGRAYDPAVFAAVPVRRGFDPGLALHLGKILECAAIAASPGNGSDCMLGVLRRDDFLVEPLDPHRACTVTWAGAISAQLIGRLYHVPVTDVLELVAFDPAAAIKITIRRPRVAGDVGETDVYGAQQHAPLLELQLDLGG